jgi:hypothetical protein
MPTPDTPKERDEKAVELSEERVVRAAEVEELRVVRAEALVELAELTAARVADELRRFKMEMRVLYGGVVICLLAIGIFLA